MDPTLGFGAVSLDWGWPGQGPGSGWLVRMRGQLDLLLTCHLCSPCFASALQDQWPQLTRQHVPELSLVELN